MQCTHVTFFQAIHIKKGLSMNALLLCRKLLTRILHEAAHCGHQHTCAVEQLRHV